MNNKKIQKRNNLYMDLAIRFAQESHAKRLKVGALLVREDKETEQEDIVSYGWNGMPKGQDNCCEDTLPDGSLVTKPEVIHAEANVFRKVLRNLFKSTQGTKLFITHSPCVDCAQLIIDAGVIEVIYKDIYRCDKGLKKLAKNNILVTKI